MSDRDLPRAAPRLALPLAATLLLVAVAALAWRIGTLRSQPGFHGTAYLPPEPAADFRLVDDRGRPATLGDYRGRGVLLFFGYTNCPDVCPLTLGRLSRTLEAMGADTADVRILLVTVDPARDTPPVLAGYVARFGPYARGLTGDSASIAGVLRDYHAYVQPTGEGGHHQVSHTSAVFGIDRRGLLRVILPVEQGEEALADDIRALLRS